jgi:two-component system sensor histidine kinase ChiS
LVDDDAVNLRAASAILQLGGYGVTTADSGKAALMRLEKSTDYSLVILDVMMPEISGYEVCKRIRKSRTGLNCQY